MDTEPGGLAEAADLFKVLGNVSRLGGLLRLIEQQPRTVGALTEASGLSQPLVSQHLRTLRQSGLVTSSRNGKEIRYALTDVHVSHVIADAITHVQETLADSAEKESTTINKETA